MSWSDHYIGIPFADFGRARIGCDCWGLACLIYRDELGIALPDYLGDYASAEEQTEIAALIDRDRASPLWLPVEGPALAFDLALFRRGRWSSHIGIVLRPGWMIHMQGEDCAKVEPYGSGVWAHRFQGCYRHVSAGVERPAQSVSEASR